MGKTIDIGGRIHNPEVGNVVTGANEILDDTKNKKQDVINSEVDSALEALDANKQDNLTFDQTPTESSTNPVTSGGVYAADLALQQAIEAILTLIPSAASALNQLADKSFVNSSIATASATFRGTYNLVSDLHLSVTASHQDIATALASAVSTADNNDYCFVQIPTSDTSSDIRVTERYKYNGTAWAYEYDLNNSGFTATQWEAINSGITALLVTKLGALPTAAELATSLAGKQNVLTFDNVPVSGSDNPVKSGGLYQLFAAIDAKFPSDASANNKLVAENRLAAYVTAIIEALDASFDLTSADGHVTFRMTQTNGVITSVQILTSDIASASALTTLGGRVSTNETDIANLQAAYAGLTQSDVIVGTLPSSGQQQNKIYRQPDPDHNPPQFYSDYMWNGSTWVLMAQYNNAIDAVPTAGSHNLVESGGVKDAIDEVADKVFEISFDLNGFLDNYGWRVDVGTSYATTEYVKVKEGEKWYYTGQFSNSAFLGAVYGYADKSTAQSAVLVAIDSAARKDYEFTIPSGVNYIRACSLNSVETNLYNKNIIEYRLSKLEDDLEIIEVGTGKQYTKVYDAFVAAAALTKKVQINIYQGEYDFYTEFGGENFISSVDPSATWDQILPTFKNKVTIKGIGDVNISMMIPDNVYETYTSVCNKLSIINNQGDIYIKDISLTAKNCRYAIHDESNGSDFIDTIHKFENIRVNTQNCLASCGIGLSTAEYEFYKCIFKGGSLYMHSWPANKGAKIKICDSVLANNLSLNNYGAYRNDVFIGNSYVSYATIGTEDSTNYTTNYFDVLMVDCNLSTLGVSPAITTNPYPLQCYNW